MTLVQIFSFLASGNCKLPVVETCLQLALCDASSPVMTLHFLAHTFFFLTLTPISSEFAAPSELGGCFAIDLVYCTGINLYVNNLG